MGIKRKREGDIDTFSLGELSVLFIPFDAAGKFYKANSKVGVHGFKGLWDDTGRTDFTNESQVLVSSRPAPDFFIAKEIEQKLPDIVRQECELVRNIHQPDSEYEANRDALVESRGPDEDWNAWSDKRRQKVEKRLKGYRHYPDIVFLSENAMGVPFPDAIDVGGDVEYVKLLALDTNNIDKIKRVNEMAVYARRELYERVEASKKRAEALENKMDLEDAENERDEGLFMKAEAVTRSTLGLTKGGKDEYIIKLTIGKRAGESLTVAGVHLRATLTSVSSGDRDGELRALKTFCDAMGIQLMVGDFNMDMQTPMGGRGIFFDPSPQSQPVFLVDNTPTIPGEVRSRSYPQYTQQYSNSSANKHYMGYFQADMETLRLVGQGAYGLLGASLSRSLAKGGKYYSDHPSIYVRLLTERLSEEAQTAIVNRKVRRIVRGVRRNK